MQLCYENFSKLSILTAIPKERSDCGNLPLLYLNQIMKIATACSKPRNDAQIAGYRFRYP